jgi:hypothetical protein
MLKLHDLHDLAVHLKGNTVSEIACCDHKKNLRIDCINTPLAVVPIVSYLFLFCKGFLHQRIRPPFPVYV